jgi:hypothetical protein
VIVAIYYNARKERKTTRRFAFFVAAWTLAFGFLLTTMPNPLLSLIRYHGVTLTAERRLWYAENGNTPSGRSSAQTRRLIEAGYSTAEKWHLWEIGMAEGLGPASPLLAVCLESTADFYGGRKEYDKAVPLYRRSRDTWEKALGPENRYAEEVHTKLADTLRAVEAARAAEPPSRISLYVGRKGKPAAQ